MRWLNASWEELDRLEAQGILSEEATAPSGRTYHVETAAFWDMEPWESGMYVNVRVYGKAGWRKRRPYKGVTERGGPEDPLPAVLPAGTRWTKEGRRWRLHE